MQVEAQLRYLRIAPRKVRLVGGLIRGKKVTEAKSLLDFSIKKAAHPLRKLLDSAVANAKNNFQLEEKDLYISKIVIDEGPKLKRWRARARGRAAQIQKKTSHIILTLEGEKGKTIEKTEEKKPEAKEERKIEKQAEPRLKGELLKPKRKMSILRPRLEKKGWKRVFKRKAF